MWGRPTAFRRSQVIVDWRFQFSYMWVWILLGTLIAAIMFGGVSFMVSRFEVDPDAKRFLLLVIGSMSGVVVLFSIVMGLLNLVMTHRVAGAAWKIRQCVQRMAAGPFDGQITLRKGDYLQSLADNLNDLNAVLLKRRGEVLEAARQLGALQERWEREGRLDAGAREEIAQILQRLQQSHASNPPAVPEAAPTSPPTP